MDNDLLASNHILQEFIFFFNENAASLLASKQTMLFLESKQILVSLEDVFEYSLSDKVFTVGSWQEMLRKDE